MCFLSLLFLKCGSLLHPPPYRLCFLLFFSLIPTFLLSLRASSFLPVPFLLFPTIFCWSRAREVPACTGFSPQLFFPIHLPEWPGSVSTLGCPTLLPLFRKKRLFTLKLNNGLELFKELSKAPGCHQSASPPWLVVVRASHLLELSLRCCLLKDYCFLVVEILYSTESLEWGCHSLPGSEGFFLLSLSVSSPRLLPALCQGFDFCQLWPGPFSYLLSFQLCSGWALLVY